MLALWFSTLPCTSASYWSLSLVTCSVLLLLLNSCAVHPNWIGSDRRQRPTSWNVCHCVSLCRFFISFTPVSLCASIALFGHILFNYRRLDVENWAKVCQTFIKLCIRIMQCLILLFPTDFQSYNNHRSRASVRSWLGIIIVVAIIIPPYIYSFYIRRLCSCIF